MSAHGAAPDPRARRMQRLHVLAVGDAAAALLDDVAASPAVRTETVTPAQLLPRLQALAGTDGSEVDSVLVLVDQRDDLRALAAGDERWHRAGPLITTIFVQDGAVHDAAWTLDGNLMRLRTTSDQLVITTDRAYPAEVIRALTQ